MKCLIGENIKLTKFDERAITPEYIGWLNDFEVNKYLDTGRLLVNKSSVFAPSDDKNLMFAVMTNVYFEDGILKKDNDFTKYIGTCSLHEIDWVSKKSKIGFMIGNTKYWSIGLCSEIVALLVDYGFGRLNLNKISAEVVVDNIGSKRVLEKNGFVRRAILSQDYYLNGKYLDTAIYCKMR